MMLLYCNLIPFRQSHPVFLCPDNCEGITTQCTHQATHTPDLCVVHAQSTNGDQCSHSYSVSIDKLLLSRPGKDLHGHIRPNTSETDKTLRFFLLSSASWEATQKGWSSGVYRIYFWLVLRSLKPLFLRSFSKSNQISPESNLALVQLLLVSNGHI